MITTTATADDYQRIFAAEGLQEYPCIEAFEQRMGFAIDRDRLEHAARILCCPVKAQPPNWQHGRVLYAAARRYLDEWVHGPVVTLDIGTAKGFSALMVRYAVEDDGTEASSFSVDVIPPCDRVRRNTIAEVNGLRTLFETVAPFPEAERITFVESTGIDFLLAVNKRIHIAFVDGKHDGKIVKREGELIAERQMSGDLCIFDDVHIKDVHRAVASLLDRYQFEYLRPLHKRAYAIGVRR